MLLKYLLNSKERRRNTCSRGISVHSPKWARFDLLLETPPLPQKPPEIFKHLKLTPSTIQEINKTRYDHAFYLYRTAYEKPLLEKYNEYYKEMQEEHKFAKKQINLKYRKKRKAGQVKKRIEILRRMIQRKMIIALNMETKGAPFLYDPDLMKLDDGTGRTFYELSDEQIKYQIAYEEGKFDEDLNEQEDEDDDDDDEWLWPDDILPEDLDKAQENLRREAQQLFTVFIRDKLKSLGLPEDTLGPLPNVPPLEPEYDAIKKGESIEDWVKRVASQIEKDDALQKKYEEEFEVYGSKQDDELFTIKGKPLDSGEPKNRDEITDKILQLEEEEIEDEVKRMTEFDAMETDPEEEELDELEYKLAQENLINQLVLEGRFEEAKGLENAFSSKGTEEGEKQGTEETEEPEEDPKTTDWDAKIKALDEAEKGTVEIPEGTDLMALAEKEISEMWNKRDTLNSFQAKLLEQVKDAFEKSKADQQEWVKPFDPVEASKVAANWEEVKKKIAAAEEAKLPPKKKTLRTRETAKPEVSEEEKALQELNPTPTQLLPNFNVFEVQIPHYTAIKMKKEMAIKTLKEYKLLTGRSIPLEEVFGYDNFPDDPKEHLKRVADGKQDTQSAQTAQETQVTSGAKGTELPKSPVTDFNDNPNVQIVEVTDEEIIKEGLNPEDFKLYKQNLTIIPDDEDIIAAIDEYPYSCF
jgi:hypothetical protein